MSDPSRSIVISPWWALALLPIGLAAGWWLGGMPVPDRAPEPVPAVVTSSPAPPPAHPPASPRAPKISIGETTVTAPADPPRNEPAPVVSSWSSMDAALSESRGNGKPILIDFSADWCPPCQAMKREVFDHGVHGRAVQTAVIPVAVVDRVREQGANPADVEALQQRYGIRAFPTLVVFSPATGRMMQTRGFSGAERTVAWIHEAAAAVR